MRRQMDGLAALVTGIMKQNPLSGGLFVFINKRRDKLKILMWERNGFVVWYKRLEQEKFQWPVRSAEEHWRVPALEALAQSVFWPAPPATLVRPVALEQRRLAAARPEAIAPQLGN